MAVLKSDGNVEKIITKLLQRLL